MFPKIARPTEMSHPTLERASRPLMACCWVCPFCMTSPLAATTREHSASSTDVWLTASRSDMAINMPGYLILLHSFSSTKSRLP